MNRRTALQSLGPLAAFPLLGAAEREALPVATIVTEYRNNSHADVIIGKILEGWQQDGGAGPDLKVAAMYTDQVPKGDMSRALARKHGFPIFNTIEEAVTLGKVRVAAVLSIGEHGHYPYTPDTGQHMYPRRRFFDAITATFRKAAVAIVNGITPQFGTAIKVRGRAKPFVNWFWLQDGKPYGHFIHLVRAIEHMTHTGQPSYPVERTLLTTGMLDRLMHIVFQKGKN